MAFSFLRGLMTVEGQKAQEAVVQVGMQVMGDAMTEAQIQTFVDAAHHADQVVGDKQRLLDQAKAKYTGTIDDFHKLKDAYDRFSAQLEAQGITDIDNPGTLDDMQTKVVMAAREALQKATALNPKRKEAEHYIEQAEQDLKDAQADADRSTERAVQARQHLQDQKDELARLQADEAREQDRVHEAKLKAGLEHQVDSMHVVDDAYARQIAERKARVATAHQEAESLRKATQNSSTDVHSDLLAQALSSTAAVPKDTKSMRAALD